jgi:rod shape-determining protein MreC
LKDFLESTRAKILAAILLVLLGFVAAAVYADGVAPMASRLLNLVTVPFQKAAASVSNSTSAFFQTHVNAEALYDENQRLREQLSEKRYEQADYERLQHENEQLREVLNIAEHRTDFSPMPATVIARDSFERFYSFSIDRGTMDGIAVRDPVITSDGLVGYVYEVSLMSAKVVTILDVDLDVGAYNSATRDIGVISGSVELAEQGLCMMEYLPRDSKTKIGDLVLTGGITTGSLFPKDIMVGEVLRVQMNVHGNSLVAIVQPAADIPNVKNVFVITNFLELETVPKDTDQMKVESKSESEANGRAPPEEELPEASESGSEARNE